MLIPLLPVLSANLPYTLVKLYELFFSTDQNEFELFYLTPDGEDVSNCGETVETACKTLRQILSIYYNTSDIPPHGLEIITSKPLITINEQLMVGRMS